jgi:type I restriction enzyme, S subunit
MRETLFESFDQFMDAPHAIDRMRELILQLAVRGKIAAQNPEESAESQLHIANSFRVQDERAVHIEADELPFSVPANWKWVSIGDAMKLINGRAFKSEEWSIEGTPIIRIQNLNNEHAPFNRCNIDVDPKVHVNDGDFLISWSGTPGTSFGAFIWNRGFAYLNQHIFRCELAQGVFLKEFLRLTVNARLDEMISHAQGGVGLRHITKGKLENIRLPLPPLAEQQRIVAKVNELIALCDRLEAQQENQKNRWAALRRAALAHFEGAPSANKLSLLFHDSYLVTPADLRKTILTLAVQGKLVAQNPKDVPAIETFTLLANSTCEGEENESPSGWMLVQLGSLGEWRGGGTPSKSNAEFWIGDVPWVSPKDMKVLRISDSEDHISEAAIRSSSVRPIPTGSVLMVVRGMILARAFPVAVTLRDVTINQDMKSLLPSEKGITDFLLIVLRALEPTILSKVERSSHGTCKLRTEALESIKIPLPPLAEQRRIVAKVDSLMSLVDQMETMLVQSQSKSNELMDAIVHELLRPDGDAVPILSAEIDPASGRAAIGCYAIKRLVQNPNFGRTMLMKVCYLSETHLGLSLGWQPMRQAAGPYDPEIETFESLGKRNDWFAVKEKHLSNGHTKVEYQAKTGLKVKAAEALALLGNQKTELDRLLSLFQDKTTEEAEIIATVFAAWNDLLIDGKSPSDDEIIREVRENWHYKKERFTPTLLTRWLNWLRQQSVIPRGLAPRTRQQLKLGLS